MSEQSGQDNQLHDPAPVPARAAGGTPAVPNRDGLSGRLAARLGRLDPRRENLAPTSVRGELVSGAQALEQRRPWWRALASAAEPANPALDPDAVAASIDDVPPDRPPAFLCLWHETPQRAGMREGEMIGFIPLASTRLGRVPLPVVVGWKPPGWHAATPLIHRRHQDAAAQALLGWLAERPTGVRAMVLRDLARDGVFTRRLMKGPGARAWSRGRGVVQIPVNAPIVERSDASPDTVLRHGHELTEAAFESSFALASLWAGDIVPDGEGAADPRVMARYRYLSAALASRQVVVAEAVRDGHVAAIVLGVRRGSTVAIIVAAANPRLRDADRDTMMRHAIGAIQSGFEDDGRVAEIQACVPLPAALETAPGQRLALTDMVIAAPGATGRLAAALAPIAMRDWAN